MKLWFSKQDQRLSDITHPKPNPSFLVLLMFPPVIYHECTRDVLL